MELDQLTVKEVRELAKLVGGETAEKHPYEVGKNYFIRTVTHYYTGKLVQVTRQELVLEDACWIADTGRFAEALSTGKLNETEPFPGKVIVGRGAVVDASLWAHALPRSVK